MLRITVMLLDGRTEGFIAEDVSASGPFLVISGEDYTTYLSSTSIVRADIEVTENE